MVIYLYVKCFKSKGCNGNSNRLSTTGSYRIHGKKEDGTAFASWDRKEISRVRRFKEMRLSTL